jgi:hypothetical protein
MELPKLLKEDTHQIKDNKPLSNHGNAARTSGINGGENNKAGANDEVTRPLPLEGTTIVDVMQMVEATAMVYKVMEEQHKIDSLVPKEPAILKDEMRLNEFALQLCRTHRIPEHDTNGRPANIFEMNTSIATLSVQCSDENSLYLEGKRVKPQCFSCHVDDKNDPEYCDVCVIYKHVQDPNSHLKRNKRAHSRDSLTSITRRWPCRKSISWTLHLMARITVQPSIGDSAILLREHWLGCAGLECSHHR